MSSRFKILCPECNAQAKMSTMKYKSYKEATLHCCCNNAECGHTFALDLSFSHELKASQINKSPSAISEPPVTLIDGRFKVICPECCDNTVITKSHRKHTLVSDLYCRCKNPACGHRFVSNLSFSHSLSPSAAKHGRLIRDLIQSIPPTERANAIEFLRQASQSLQVK